MASTASGEIAGAGAVSGDYTATWADDAGTLSITERGSGGKKNGRYSYLPAANSLTKSGPGLL